MFAYIKGTLLFVSSTHAIVEAGSIGYKIFIPTSAFAKMPQIGMEVTMHLSFIVREQVQALYGFFSMQERDFFESLLGVTGIGPKIALSLIGHMPVADLQQAILQEDTKTICRVPGIGKKGAERLIIEMRDKVGAHASSPADFAVRMPLDPKAQLVNDAMSALINLGYHQMTAQKAVQKSLKESDEDIDLPALISSSLKHV